MKALAIRQPWVWAILHRGKDIENREWGDRYPALREAEYLARTGEEILLLASSGMTRVEFENGMETITSISPSGYGMPTVKTIERGGIIGRVRISEVVYRSQSPWFFGPVGLVLSGAKPTKFVPFKGTLGFFDVPNDVAREALALPQRVAKEKGLI